MDLVQPPPCDEDFQDRPERGLVYGLLASSAIWLLILVWIFF